MFFRLYNRLKNQKNKTKTVKSAYEQLEEVYEKLQFSITRKF